MLALTLSLAPKPHWRFLKRYHFKNLIQAMSYIDFRHYGINASILSN